ncbi:11615_t:CDS:2, partial [Acaulospora morrowiae]
KFILAEIMQVLVQAEDSPVGRSCEEVMTKGVVKAYSKCRNPTFNCYLRK